MIKKSTPFILIIISLFSLNAFGEYSLYMPIGVRSKGMGSTGYALSDDETSLYYNPAGLGLRNYRWNGGAISFFISPIPTDVYNTFYSIVYQNQNLPQLGFSSYWNHVDFGTLDELVEGPDGQPVSTGNKWFSYEFTIASGAGYSFCSNGLVDNSAGIAVKYYRSLIGSTAGTSNFSASAFAIDLGYIFQLISKFRFGLVLRNIGTDISYNFKDTTGFNNSKLPVSLVCGLGYKDSFNYMKLRILDISSEFSLLKIFNRDYHYINGLNIYSINTGADFSFFKTLSTRFGYSESFSSSFNYFTWGAGLSLFNHFDLDIFQCIYVGDAQPTYGFSFCFKRVLNWNINDLRWWFNW